MKTKTGFTLIELLVVIAIIGILAAVTLSAIDTARDKARHAKHKQLSRQLQIAMEMYYSENGFYNDNGSFVSNCNHGGFGSDIVKPVMDAFKDNMLDAWDDRVISCYVNEETWAISAQSANYQNTSGQWCSDYTGYAGVASIDGSSLVAGIARCDS